MEILKVTEIDSKKKSAGLEAGFGLGLAFLGNKCPALFS